MAEAKNKNLKFKLNTLCDDDVVDMLSELAVYFDKIRSERNILPTCCLLASVSMSTLLSRSGLDSKIVTCEACASSKQVIDMSSTMSTDGPGQEKWTKEQIQAMKSMGARQVRVIRQRFLRDSNAIGGHVVVFVKLGSGNCYLYDPTSRQFRRPSINVDDGFMASITKKMYEKAELFLKKECKNNEVAFHMPDQSILQYRFGPIDFMKQARLNKELFKKSDLNPEKHKEIIELLWTKWLALVLERDVLPT